ncbi:MAG: hypothetical protein FJZ86_04675 [Chloroflexi bacterium]|nr:hypothetical protein [Chloroflexota bacterium]
MKENAFSSITLKTAIVHTVTYFIIGFFAFTFFDYSAKYAGPIVSNFMRQTDHPLVAAGPLFQVLRGFLFGIVFYVLRDLIFPKERGWLTLWLVLVIVGIISPFGPSPSSIEGALYTIMPMWFHIVGLPEVLIQSFLLAYLTHYWVKYPEKKWLGWIFGIIFALVILMSSMGILAALGILPAQN